MWNLNDTAVEELLELPETGMGFQLVEASIWGTVSPLLVLNGQRAIDLSQAGLVEGDDPAIVLRNGLRIIEAMKGDVALTMIAAPGLRSFKLLQGRIGPTTGRGITTGASVAAALPSSLIKHDTLKANRVFYRYSAFSPDKRVDPKTGNFLPGTYAAPASEVPFVPTGFIAVGRFALPNTLPASYRYEIEAPRGTSVDFGTVAPAFGQAGGGVEAYFAKSVTNAKVPPAGMVTLPDE